MVYIMR
ncbi:hypothetical protein YPPY56_1381, partial [Yersinia pestis PY-56]